ELGGALAGGVSTTGRPPDRSAPRRHDAVTMEPTTSVGVGPGTRQRPGLELALAAASVGVFELRPESGRMRWTKEFASLHHLDPELLGGTIDVLEAQVHADDHARLRAALEDSHHGIHVQYRLGGPGECWLELRAQPISESDSSALV